MPQVTNVVFQNFFNKLKNGDNFTDNPADFTQNLAANVQDEIRVITRLEVSMFAEASATDTWVVSSDSITRNAGDFRADGWYIGARFRYQSDWRTTPQNQFTADVQSISSDGKTLVFNNVVLDGGGSIPVGTGITADAIRFLALVEQNFLFGLTYKFGLIGNDENLNYNSKVSGVEQSYYSNEVGLDLGGGNRSQAFQDMLPTQETNQSWVSGSARARFVSNPSQYIQEYEVEHTFLLLPFYVDGDLSRLVNLVNDADNVSLPDIFEGTDTLRYVIEANFQTTLSNPNNSILAEINDRLGACGWYLENFNGQRSNYEFFSIEYTDVNTGQPVDSVQLTARTRIIFRVKRKDAANFGSPARAGAIITYLPSQSEYTDTPTPLRENFRFDSLYNASTQPPTVGTNIIKECDVTQEFNPIEGFLLRITIEVEYTAAQRIGLSGDSFYLLSLIVANPTIPGVISDRVTIPIDVRQFTPVTFVQGLISFSKFNFLEHNEEFGVDEGNASIVAVNEDGILIDATFVLDLTKQAVINSLKMSLVALNPTTGDFFELDVFNFDFGGVIISSGVQQIEIDLTRGYRLVQGDQFNYARIQTAGNVGGQQSYNIQLGQKISWETWIQNLQADGVFFDAGQPNNNLNFKASNYSELNNYQIVMLAEADLNGLDDLDQPIAGITRIPSGDIVVQDYDNGNNTPDPPVWSVVEELLEPTTFANTGGILLSDRPTLYRCTFTNSNGAVTDISNYYALHRLEVENAQGKQIEELSTERPAPGNQILIPLPGFDFLRIYLLGGNVVTECYISNTRIDLLTKYKLSCRIDSGEAVTVNGMAYEDLQIQTFEDGQPQLFEDQTP